MKQIAPQSPKVGNYRSIEVCFPDSKQGFVSVDMPISSVISIQLVSTTDTQLAIDNIDGERSL